jgi:(S)-sulfolactate dehydrogenase
MRARILITEFMDDFAVEALAAKFEVNYQPEYVHRRTDLLAAVTDVDALIVRNLTQVDAGVIAAAPKLRVVGRLGVGLDNLDMEGLKARGVTVYPASGANAWSVAEYVIGTTMLLLRGAYQASSPTAAGKWQKVALSRGFETRGKTLGLIGFGEIGRLAAGLARALGMQVVAHDPMVKPDDPVWQQLGAEPLALDTLLPRADVVSLHVPLNPGTRDLINAARIAQMKKGAMLINTARGGIVDEAALAEALIAGHLGGAAIDVYATEPLPAGTPLSRAVEAGVRNLVLTPHIAGLTLEANTRVAGMIAERVTTFLESHAAH